MKCSATYQGEAITIVNINQDGCDVYITYIPTSATDLRVTKTGMLINSTYTSIATSATAVS
jgi:hypothetical protein